MKVGSTVQNIRVQRDSKCCVTIAYLKAMHDFSPLCKISHVQTFPQPSCAWFGSVSSFQNALHAVKVEVHELENQTFLFHQINRRSHFTPSPTWIVACFSKEHQHQLVSFGRAELQAGGKRGAFTCHLLPKASKDQQGECLFWRIRSTTEWRTSSNFVLVKKNDTQWKINLVLCL